MTHRSRITSLARAVAAATLAVVTLALPTLGLAQTALDYSPFGFRVEVPDAWPVDESIDDGEVFLAVAAPAGVGALIVAAGPFGNAERSAYEAGGLPGLLDLAFTLVQNLPGAQRGDLIDTTIAGTPAAGFAFQGSELGGRFVYLVSDEWLFVLGAMADAEAEATVDAAFERAVATFTLVGAAAEAFVGSFSGDGLTLVLQRTDGGYAGSLTFDGQTFTVSASEAVEGALAGEFVAAGTAFGFDLVQDGDALVLTSGGSRYRLR